MDIEIKKQDDQNLVFIISGVDVPLVNAIRRISMVEVPTLAIDQVEFLKNDARIFDEALAHRLGQVPIVTDLEVVKTREECDCEDYCPSCSVSLVLKGKGPRTMYSGDLKSSDPKIKPVMETIPLLKLKEGEEVELEAIAQIGTGTDHAKWQPTTSCAYNNYPMITIDTEKCEACGDCVNECPRSVYELDEKKGLVKIVDLENCSLCKTCVKDCPNNAITVEGAEDKFIFRIETDGSLSPVQVLSKACDILSEKTDIILDSMKKGGALK
jgi:DNA-directed RNA polymerase subunit D